MNRKKTVGEYNLQSKVLLQIPGGEVINLSQKFETFDSYFTYLGSVIESLSKREKPLKASDLEISCRIKTTRGVKND